MKRAVLGVIGHVDHGKTALVRALTGTDTDRLGEEKQRGISIALGFAHMDIGPDTQIDLIDMPGHERFVRTMVCGATGIDAVLLVVAANEGIMPQTREHIDIASLLGLREAVIAISKTDLVTADRAREVADDTVRLLVRAGLEPLPPIMTSALAERGLDAVRDALQHLADKKRPRDADGIAYLPIDRAFNVVGHGAVVTGTLRGTQVSPDDVLELLPPRRKLRVRSVQVHGARTTTAMPGQRVALNLRDVEYGELKRGMALAAPDAFALSDWLTIAVRAIDSAPPLKNGMRLRALLGTDERDVRLRLLDGDVLEPGASGFAQLRCTQGIALPAREHVILRLPSPAGTVAGGRILEPVTMRQKRNNATLLQRLRDLNSLAPAAILMAEIERAGGKGISLKQLSETTALSARRIMELLAAHPVVTTRVGDIVRQSDIDKLVARIPVLLAPESAGLSPDALLAALPGMRRAVLDEALRVLLTRGAVARRGSQIVVPSPDQERARATGEAEFIARIAETLRQGGLAPPDPKTILADPQARRAVDRLLREGVIVRAVDRAKGKEILFHQDAVEEAKQRLLPHLQSGSGLLVTEIGAALGISRKYTMPLVDHLDSIRFTRRVQDRRLLDVKPVSKR